MDDDDSPIQLIPKLGGCWLCSKLSFHEQESSHSLVHKSYIDKKIVNHTPLVTKKYRIGKKIMVSKTTGFSSSWIICWEKKNKSCTIDNQNNTGSVHNLGFQESLDFQILKSYVDKKKVNHAWLATKITLNR
jgi:hypothetical protein